MLAGYTLDRCGVPQETISPPAARGFTSRVYSTRAQWKGGENAFEAGRGSGRARRAKPAAQPRLRADRSRRARRSRPCCWASGCPIRRARLGSLEVTDSLLGGSFASRITSNIREQKGYTYSPQHVNSHPRSAMGRDRRRHDESDRCVTEGDLLEIDRLRKEPRPPPSCGASRTTWPASSSCRTPRAAV